MYFVTCHAVLGANTLHVLSGNSKNYIEFLKNCFKHTKYSMNLNLILFWWKTKKYKIIECHKNVFQMEKEWHKMTGKVLTKTKAFIEYYIWRNVYEVYQNLKLKLNSRNKIMETLKYLQSSHKDLNCHSVKKIPLF